MRSDPHKGVARDACKVSGVHRTGNNDNQSTKKAALSRIRLRPESMKRSQAKTICLCQVSAEILFCPCVNHGNNVSLHEQLVSKCQLDVCFLSYLVLCTDSQKVPNARML